MMTAMKENESMSKVHIPHISPNSRTSAGENKGGKLDTNRIPMNIKSNPKKIGGTASISFFLYIWDAPF